MKGARVILLLLTGLVTAAPAESPWWNTFESEVLSRLIESGLASHPDPAAAMAQVQAARQDQQRVRSAVRPSAGLHFAARAGREKTMYTDRKEGDIDPFAGEARISWELDLFGRVRHATKAAEARTEMSDADRRGVRLVLGTEIARLVFEVASLQQIAVTDQRIQDAVLRLDGRARARTLAGLEAQPGSDRARARYEAVQQQRQLTGIQLEKSLNRLNRLVGTAVVPDQIPPIMTFTLPSLPAFEADRRMEGRPDVMSAWWQLQGFLSEAQAAKRANAPTLAVVASAAGEASESEIEPWKAWIGPTIQLPLWRPDLRAAKRRALAQAEAARAQFASVSLTALREIEDARIERMHTDELIAYMAGRRKNLAKAEAVEKRKRGVGLTQESEWLEAHITYLQAEREELISRKNALVVHLELLKALGGDENPPGALP